MKSINFFQKYNPIKSCLIFGTPSENDFPLTVFIPTYKRADLLLQTIESLLKCPEDVPIVILDNNPDRNDETEQQLTAYYAKNKKICYYKNEKNIGMFGNWNRCFELCKTPWLYMLHDDDLIYPDGISILLKSLKRHINAAIITFQEQSFLHSKNISFPAYRGRNTETALQPYYVFAGNRMNPSATCFNVAKVKQTGGFNEYFFPSSDYEFCCRILRTGAKVIASHQVVVLRRMGNNESSNHDTIQKFIFKDDELLQEHLSFFNNKLLRRLLDICKNGYLRIKIRESNPRLPQDYRIHEKTATFFEKGIYFIYCWSLCFIFRERFKTDNFK